MVELKGEKVILRTLEREHCRQLWERYEPVEPVPTKALNAGLSVEGADKWFDEMQARQGHEHVYLGVFTPEGELLGDVQLANINWRDRTATLGDSMSHLADRGAGYGADTARTILRYGFRELGLHRVEGETAEFNTAICQDPPSPCPSLGGRGECLRIHSRLSMTRSTSGTSSPVVSRSRARMNASCAF